MTDFHRVIRQSTMSFGALLGYFIIIVFFNENVLGVRIGFTPLVCILLVAVVGIRFLIRRLLQWQLVSESGLLNLTLTSTVTLIGFVLVDIASTAYISSHKSEILNSEILSDEERLFDPNGWIGEWYPRLYYPTQKNFQLHKPNFTLIGEHYGNFYRPELARSPILAGSVLQKQHVTIHINELGFRESKRLEDCNVYALGDSFTFGWGVTEGKDWIHLLGRGIGTCVYNLGLVGASPKQEFLLLKYMIEKEGGRLPIKHLLWVIYEGNDLEDSYDELRPVMAPPIIVEGTLSRLFKETLIGNVYGIAVSIKGESWINRLKQGQLKLALPVKHRETDNHYAIDGVKLVNPLYHSPIHGYVLFFKPYLELASKPESYLLNHPHRQLLVQTFKDMAALASKFHFRVTVVLAPTANRLYARYFDNLSQATQKPYFINYLEKLSGDAGFDTINLLTALQPYARRELLYFRDDDHWNERGGQVVAEIVKQRLDSKRNRG